MAATTTDRLMMTSSHGERRHEVPSPGVLASERRCKSSAVRHLTRQKKAQQLSKQEQQAVSMVTQCNSINNNNNNNNNQQVTTPSPSDLRLMPTTPTTTSCNQKMHKKFVFRRRGRLINNSDNNFLHDYDQYLIDDDDTYNTEDIFTTTKITKSHKRARCVMNGVMRPLVLLVCCLVMALSCASPQGSLAQASLMATTTTTTTLTTTSLNSNSNSNNNNLNNINQFRSSRASSSFPFPLTPESPLNSNSIHPLLASTSNQQPFIPQAPQFKPAIIPAAAASSQSSSIVDAQANQIRQDSFGSRLANQNQASDSSAFAANNRHQQQQQQFQPFQVIGSGQQASAAQRAGSGSANLLAGESALFSNRQGQLLGPAQDVNRARATRQQQQVTTMQRQNNNQQQAGLIGLPSDHANRFQRIRAPPNGEQQQQQQPSGLIPMPPLPAPQFPVNPQIMQQQQQSGNRQQAPTLSAFDLSSLTNLANQAGNFGQPQQQAVGAFTRRIPAVNSQLQQGQNSNQNFQRLNGNSQIQNQNSQMSPTELPFIRQVFRPVADSEQQQQQQPQGSSGRPTPPPLFVPGASQSQRLQGQLQRQRPISSSNNNDQNQVSNQIGGFAPISRQNSLQESIRLQPHQQQGGQSGRGSEQVFFEPSSQLTRSQSSSLPTTLSSPISNNFARIQQNQQQQGRLINGLQQQQQQQSAQTTTQRPQLLSFQQTQQQHQAGRRTPVRRPSQRPQLPQFIPSNDVVRLAAQQQAQQQATGTMEGLSLSPLTTPASVSSPVTSQGTNEQYVASSTPASQSSSATEASLSTSSSSPAHHQSSSSSNQFGSILSEWSGSTTSSSGSMSTSTTESPLISNSAAAAATTTLAPAQFEQGRRNSLAPPLVRSSANIFALTSISPTSAPSSFSPALPINQAAGASASGRRRIPIRPMQGGRGSGQQPVAGVPTTTTTTTTAASAASPTSSTTQVPPTTTTLTSAGSSLSVRKPEIEEFYETIAQQGGLGAPAATQIDAFGSAQRHQLGRRPSNQQSFTTPGSSSTTTSQTVSSPSDNGPDLYGSRLPPISANNLGAQEQPISSSSNQFVLDSPPGAPVDQQPANANQQQQAASPVLVPVTYMTVLTYMTTVLHGTHTLETSHESTVKSTQLATLNAQLMDQIEHRKPLIEPTMTLAVSSKTKGKGTTLVNLKSLVSAYNEELVEALGQQHQHQATPTSSINLIAPTSTLINQPQASSDANSAPVLALNDLSLARKSLVTELIYHYTIRPLQANNSNGAAAIEATSVRSELVNAKSLEADELAQLVAAGASASNKLVDANGLLQLDAPAKQQQQVINLGTNIDKEGLFATEVNMNVASYIKFDDISSRLVDLRPSRLAGALENNQSPPPTNQNSLGAPNARQSLLDTSFNLQLAFASALDMLAAPSGQQTPALDSVNNNNLQREKQREPTATTTSNNDLLRANQAEQSNQRGSSVTSNLARSSLRNRVASSRIRATSAGVQMQSQLVRQSASLAEQIANNPNIVVSSVVLPAGDTNATLMRNQKPFRSRVVRPQKSSLLSSHHEPSAELVNAAISSQAATTPSISSQLLTPVRSSKPRFVVVTRTGQFGVRSSAINGASASPVAASSSDPAGSSADQSGIQPSSVAAPPASSSSTSSSRFLKPNRFRQRPSVGQRLNENDTPASSTTTAQTTAGPVTTQKPSTAGQQPAGTTTRTHGGNSASEQDSLDSSSSTTTSSPIITVGLNGQQPTTSNGEQQAPSSGTTSSQDQANANANLDSSVLVTYFTTTTHTIAFTMSSDTIFTTVEETNSRIATEAMRDLAATPILQQATPTIEPTQMVSSVLMTPKMSSEMPPQAGSTSSSLLTTTGADQAEANNSNNNNKAKIEPSFVVTLNTRTYFTTYTTFTTHLPGAGATASLGQPVIESSERTTSNIVTETVTSMLPASVASIEPTSVLMSSPAMATDAADSSSTSTTTPEPINSSSDSSSESTSAASNSNGNSAESSSAPVTTTSTTSPPKIEGVDISTGTQNDESARPQISNQDQQQAIAPISTGDKIIRTRSMYTTLTHTITLYSQGKTQLSTIQEISPTVMTDYIDRTDYERQQALESARAKDSGVLMVPTELGSASIQITPTPVVPMTTTMATSLASESSQPTTSSQPSQTTTTAAAPEENTTQSNQQQQVDTTTSTTTSSTTTTASSTSSDNNQASSQADTNSDGWGAGESRQGNNNNIIELSDLIAANSSQSGRVALAGNLGAAIKDIVQLLAGNKSTNANPILQQQPPATVQVPVSTGNNEQAATTTSMNNNGEDSTQPTTTTTTTTTTTSSSQPTSQLTSLRSRPGQRIFGPKAKHQQMIDLEGSLGSSGDRETKFVLTHQKADTAVKPTPELPASVESPASGDKATIFYADIDQVKQQQLLNVKQSTQFVTSVEPSTRTLTLTSTRVYYTRDSPITVTSSYVSTIAPRTFVSTISGTKTLVNQLASQTAVVATTTITTTTPSQPEIVPVPKSSASTQQGAKPGMHSQRENAQVQPNGSSRQNDLAANNRLALQEKQRKQAAQVEANQRKLEALNQPKLPINQQQQQSTTNNNNNVAKQQPQQQKHAANQCHPACKDKANEVCKFNPLEQTFGCVCRPGYSYVQNLNTGKRQCQEILSYVILLRLLQIGDQQVAYKRELQDRSSSDYKQMSRIIRDHVKRAYMTSELTRDRFVGADVTNYARSLSTSSPVSSQHLNLPVAGKVPVNGNNLTHQDPLGSGLIVNITVQLQPPATNQNEIINELTLKEELTKKLNLRQAAALAAAAAAAAGAPTPSTSTTSTTATIASSSDNEDAKSNSTATPAAGAAAAATSTAVPSLSELADMAEALPNPNALFLADVEQVSDLDECSAPSLNDCHEAASCINELGSYRCDCGDYPDLSPLHPGRVCGLEIKACDYCNNRGDCIRVPSLLAQLTSQSGNNSTFASGNNGSLSNNNNNKFSTVCQCNPFYLGRRCDINVWVLATVVPTTSILLIVSICLIIYLCRRWRKRSALSKGFRNIGTFGPNLITGTLDRKAMLESSSESSDTHQRSNGSHHHQHHHNHHHSAHNHLHGHQSVLQHHHHNLTSAFRGPANAIYDVHGAMGSDPSTSSSQESSPRQMVRNHGSIDTTSSTGPQPAQQPYCSSIPPQIVIPRARHNQVNYAVHRGQVYMW